MERRDLEEALVRKGFQPEQAQGRDHRYYRLFVDGKKTKILTKVSMGTGYRTLGPPLVQAIAKQLMVEQQILRDFVECTVDGPAYVAAVRARFPDAI